MWKYYSILENTIEASNEISAGIEEEVSIMAAISIVESLQVVEINSGMRVNCEECSQLHPSNEEYVLYALSMKQ